MVVGKNILRESSDPIKEAVNGIDAWEVNLDGAVKDARSLAKPDRKGMAKVEYWRGSWDKLSQKSAYDYGCKVAKDLIWYTTEDDQKNVTRRIEKITVDTLVSFFEGYDKECHANWPRDDFNFFDQLRSEMGFDKKMRLFDKIAKLMEILLSNRGYKNKSNQIRSIRNQSKISGDDAQKLDHIGVGILNHEYD